MTSPNFAAGAASDALIRITSPSTRTIALSGRELRREAARRAKREAKSQRTINGFQPAGGANG
jgi:hypothetical protein